MTIRLLKIVLVIFAGLQGALYAAQNLVNLDGAYMFAAATLSMEGHELYPNAIGPGIDSPAVLWLILAVIIAGELAIGLLSALGAWRLWQRRKAPAADFNAAKTLALWGAGLGIIVWYGFFAILGGAYFQMWQIEMGQGPLNGAFHFGTISALIFLIVAKRDE